MNSYNKKAMMFAALLATVALAGCSDNKPPAQPVQYQQAPVAMVQQCGQNMQTGQQECILVPAQQNGQYAQQQQPAPQQAQSSGAGMGTVLAVGALAGTAGYLAAKNSNGQATGYQQQAPAPQQYSRPYTPGPAAAAYTATGNTLRAAPVQAPAWNKQFVPQAAPRMATVKPMSIPPSAAPRTAFAPATRPVFTPQRAAPRPSFTPTRSAPTRSTFKSTSARR